MFSLKVSGCDCFLNINARVLQACCESAFAGESSGSIPSVQWGEIAQRCSLQKCRYSFVLNLIILQVTKKFFNSVRFCNF